MLRRHLHNAMYKDNVASTDTLDTRHIYMRVYCNLTLDE